MKLKIFLDGADRSSMVDGAKNPQIQGFTTNPSLMRKSGVSDYKAFCKEILPQLNGKPVSFEVFADDFREMHRQAMEIRSWETPGSQIYVKIPISNSKGETAIPLVRELAQSGVRLNVTAIFTLSQVWDTVQAVKGGAPSIVSVFAGRIADTGRDPIPAMSASAELCRSTDKNIELLWASSREALNIIQAEQSGCHIITATGDLIKKMAMFGKDLNKMSLETVQMFKTDAEAAGFKL